jgi:hypothetical protein
VTVSSATWKPCAPRAWARCLVDLVVQRSGDWGSPRVSVDQPVQRPKQARLRVERPLGPATGAAVPSVGVGLLVQLPGATADGRHRQPCQLGDPGHPTMAEGAGDRPAHRRRCRSPRCGRTRSSTFARISSSVESPSTWRTYRNHPEDSNLYGGGPWPLIRIDAASTHSIWVDPPSQMRVIAHGPAGRRGDQLDAGGLRRPVGSLGGRTGAKLRGSATRALQLRPAPERHAPAHRR